MTTLSVDTFAVLSEAQAHYLARIDEDAGALRSKYLTVSPGQSDVYAQKAADAQAYKDAGYPADATSYPWVAARASSLSITAQQAADGILSTRAQWTQFGAPMEGVREARKAQVRAATTARQAYEAWASAKSDFDVIDQQAQQALGG